MKTDALRPARLLALALLSWLATILTAAAATTPVVTYVLSLNDNGAGSFSLNNYALYALTSTGDNVGLANFSVTTANQATTANVSPQAVFTADDGSGNTMTSGFTLLRSTGRSGNATTGSFDTISGAGVATYGIGQMTGNVRDAAPWSYTPSTTAAQGAFGVTHSFTVNPVINGTFTGSGGRVPVLLVTGTYVLAPTLSSGTANVFTGSGLATVGATVSLQQRNLAVPEPASLVAVALGGVVLAACLRRRTGGSAL